MKRELFHMRIKLTRPAGVSVRRINTKYAGRRIKALVLSPEDGAENAPGVLWIHGGGYITGTKETVYMTRAVDLVTDHGAVIVAPDYGIAPIRPYPAALDDCYAALLWMHDHAEELCIDKERLAVGGVSAGGGLCAAVCMRARDEGSVKISFQLPLYPMLDDRDTESSRDNHGRIWNTKRNHFGWRMYLRKTDKNNVPPYAAPARQTDCHGLPPCYTFVGRGEPFFSETLKYVSDLRAAGVAAECDVYDTDIHAFDMLYPELPVSREASAVFNERICRIKVFSDG